MASRGVAHASRSMPPQNENTHEALLRGCRGCLQAGRAGALSVPAPACRRRATATTADRAGAGRRDRKRLRDRTLSEAGYCLLRLLRVAAQIAEHRRELVCQLLAVDAHVIGRASFWGRVCKYV